MRQIDFSENRVHMVKPFDPHYVLNVLADIWGRENGYDVEVTLTPKEPDSIPDKEQPA